jgi:hypothetical protein
MTPAGFRLLAHAALGACLGLFAAIFFWVLYFGQTFDAPVSSDIRFRTAFWATVIILWVIVVIFNWRAVVGFFRSIVEGPEDEIEFGVGRK